jgi:UDP-glucose 4-epimerase
MHLYRALHGIRVLSLRLANPFGMGQDSNRPQGAVGVFFTRILQGQPITVWGDGEVVRDYVTAQDVSRAFVAAVNYDGEHSVFNIGTGKGTSLNHLLELMFQVTGKAVTVEYTSTRDIDVPQNILSISLAKREMGWHPRHSLREGIDMMLKQTMGQTNVMD